MNLYEHTIIARQDTSPSEIKQLSEKYSSIIEKNDGEIVKTENWGLLNLSYLIKKNKKGSYIHFKFKGKGNVISELEKNEAIDKKLLRYLTVRVKKFDLETNFFSKKDEYVKDVNGILNIYGKMVALGFYLKGDSHPITPVMLGDAAVAQKMSKELLEQGLYAVGFFYPVVPKGQARIRLQITSEHNKEQLDKAVDIFEKIGKSLGVI